MPSQTLEVWRTLSQRQRVALTEKLQLPVTCIQTLMKAQTRSKERKRGPPVFLQGGQVRNATISDDGRSVLTNSCVVLGRVPVGESLFMATS